MRLILLLGVMILCFLLLERGNSYEKKGCSTIAMYILYSTLYLMKVVSASLFLKIVYQYKVSVIKSVGCGLYNVLMSFTGQEPSTLFM